MLLAAAIAPTVRCGGGGKSQRRNNCDGESGLAKHWKHPLETHK